MKQLKHLFLIFGAFLVLMPGLVSFSHIFSGHEHHLCHHYAKKHFHAKDLDCDLYKYHSNPALEISFLEFPVFIPKITREITVTPYEFLEDHKPLCYDLRGPPARFT
ncbi:MAG: hypothetical protein VX712_03380 [Bacteroidota bacterium]|nr:hypothetical protein [Christiangramia sp.]MEE2771233.1 hypothetical protein [Bacteroidota bacterium]